MGPLQGLTVGLRHSDIPELSFLNQFLERPCRFLDWDVRIDSSAFKQVQFLCPSEVLVDVVNAASQIPFTCCILSRGSEKIWG